MSSLKCFVSASGYRFDSQMLSFFLESSAKSADGSDPGFFQISASSLGLEACDILCVCVCVPFKSGVRFLHFSDFPESRPCWHSKPDTVRLVFLVQDSQPGEPAVRFRPLGPWGEPLQF